jgi:DNA-binding transcriptional MocR family regulator
LYINDTNYVIVLIVPGIFFDVNPSHRRDLFESPCHHFVRLSFGPPMEDLERGLQGIERLLKRHNYCV